MSSHTTTHTAPPFTIPQNLLDQLTKLGPLLDAATAVHDLGVEIFREDIYQKPLDTDLKVVSYILFTKGFKTLRKGRTPGKVACPSARVVNENKERSK